jgi:hypothetical protein
MAERRLIKWSEFRIHCSAFFQPKAKNYKKCLKYKKMCYKKICKDWNRLKTPNE